MVRRIPPLLLMLLALLGGAGAAIASPAAPGDTASTVTLFSNFDTDVVGATPDLTLPGAPAGDYLTLNQASGTVLVNAQIDGLTMVAQMKQQSGTGGVSLFAWPAPPPPGTQKVTVGWRSVAQDDNPVTFIACALRGSNGNLIASVEYTPHGVLTWDGLAGASQTLPVTYQQNRNNAFRLVADLATSTVSLSVDGVAIPGFQNVPFAQPATDVARIGFEAGGTSPQTFAIDDIWAVAFSVEPDHAPAVTAPATITGTEAMPLSFTVTASDPDGQAITSLTAAPLPAGASFAANASNTLGTFAWTPTYAQSGTYGVTFTASNALSGSAVTSVVIANLDRPPVVSAPASAAVEELGHIDVPVTASDPDGDPIDLLAADLSTLPPGNTATFSVGPGNTSGTLSWTTAIGQAGEYPVAFAATANGATGTDTTRIFVAAFGTAVTGRFIWDTQPGQEGTYTVTFVASDAGGTSTLDVPVTILPSAGALAAPSPSTSTRAAGPRGALAPQLAMKGPVISVDGTTTTKSGSTLTLDATATSSTLLLFRKIELAPSPTGSKTSSATASLITLTADLSNLPPGNDAVFLVDREPIVNAPAQITGEAGLPLTVSVGADDPDGDAILTFTADLSGLPAGNNATFTTNSSHTLGTLTWTPALSDSGSWTVSFQATNRLVGTAATSIQVRGIAGATVFGTPKKLNLGSSKPFYSVSIEPINGSFDPADVDIYSVVMISEGTGSVSQIGIANKTMGTLGDKDKDGVEDMTVQFSKADLRRLFSLLRGSVSVPVVLQGNLMTGGRFRGTMTIDVQAGTGQLAATVVPNPLNPSAVLHFVTSRPGEASVRLFDVTGRMVRELLPRTYLDAGDHELRIGAEDGAGRKLASGVYFYRIEAAEGSTLGRIAVVK
ncbi:MAG: Ig-like domain-containing protein [Bacteroidota bacterium]